MANRDINIKASLEKTTATGPGPLQVPTLNLKSYDLPHIPDPRYLQQLQAMRMPQMPQLSPQQMMPQRVTRRPGMGSGGLSNSYAPPATGPGGVPYGMVPTYVSPSTGFNMGGGYRQATANEPGAIFAGYVPESAMPQQVNVAPIPQTGMPSAHLSRDAEQPVAASAGLTKRDIDMQLAALAPEQRQAAWEQLRRLIG